MTKKTFLQCLTTLFTVFFLSACATVVRPSDSHSVANEDFSKRLRWADYSGASQYMTDMARNKFFTQFGGTDDLRVVEFSTEQVEFNNDGRQADVWYKLEYYLLPSASVKKKRIKLQWEYHEESQLRSGVWRISSEFPPLP